MSLQIEVTSAHDLTLPTPIRIAAPANKVPLGAIMLRSVNGGAVPAQRLNDETVIASLSGLKANEPVRYILEASDEPNAGVGLAETEQGLNFTLPDGVFTTYRFSKQWARPFLYPVHGPDRTLVTRGYPVAPDIDGETHDHPHHKSLWSAYGEVNGMDDWSEAEGRHGYIRHQEFTNRDAGAVCAGFQATAHWVGHDGDRVLDEERSIYVYNAGPDMRLLDYNITLIANHGEVHFGDTKEGGIICVRVATALDGNKGGRIENSAGGVMEDACWGQRAAWCDYSGVVSGTPVGIAVMDHPSNLHHPTRWHVRNYGLMGSNSFAEGAFTGGQSDGYRLAAEGRLEFRYRVLIHRGNAAEGAVAEAYASYIAPPAANAVG